MSLNPYSSESPHELYSPPDFFRTSGSAASAATARPRKQGVSDPAQPYPFGSGSFTASRQFSSRTPNFSRIASVRMNPGVTATAATPCGASSSAAA
jgi:hypothetical protein